MTQTQLDFQREFDEFFGPSEDHAKALAKATWEKRIAVLGTISCYQWVGETLQLSPQQVFDGLEGPDRQRLDRCFDDAIAWFREFDEIWRQSWARKKVERLPRYDPGRAQPCIQEASTTASRVIIVTIITGAKLGIWGCAFPQKPVRQAHTGKNWIRAKLGSEKYQVRAGSLTQGCTGQPM